jgi:hypothetical protein
MARRISPQIGFAHASKTQYGLIDIPPWAELLVELEAEVSNSTQDILISSETSAIGFINKLMK